MRIAILTRGATLEAGTVQAGGTRRARNREDAMPLFRKDIVSLAQQNTFFRKEIVTNEKSQVVLMSLEPGEDIGEEVHEVDQLLFFVSGQGVAILDGQRGEVAGNYLVSVPAGTRHNFVATGTDPLKLFTIYAPPEEAPGTVHKTKEEAIRALTPVERPQALD